MMRKFIINKVVGGFRQHGDIGDDHHHHHDVVGFGSTSRNDIVNGDHDVNGDGVLVIADDTSRNDIVNGDGVEKKEGFIVDVRIHEIRVVDEEEERGGFGTNTVSRNDIVNGDGVEKKEGFIVDVHAPDPDNRIHEIRVVDEEEERGGFGTNTVCDQIEKKEGFIVDVQAANNSDDNQDLLGGGGVRVDEEEQQQQHVQAAANSDDNQDLLGGGGVRVDGTLKVAFHLIRKKVVDLLTGQISASDIASFCKAVVAFINMLEAILPYVAAVFLKFMSLFSPKPIVGQDGLPYHVSSTPNQIKVAFLLQGVQDAQHLSFYFHGNNRLHITGFGQNPCGLFGVDTFADLPHHDYSSANTDTCFDIHTCIFLVTITGFN